MTADLTPGRITHWVTGTAAPCLSLFKPVALGHPLPPMGPTPTDRYDPESLWWRHERLHRTALDDFPAALAMIGDERDGAETAFRERMNDAWARGDAAVGAAITTCWDEAAAIEARWTAAITGGRSGPSVMGRALALSWARLNSVAGFSHD
jgi:secernin